MSWNLEQIPKKLHMYWGGQKMSFIRYAGIVSFAKLNPDWEIILHTTLERRSLIKTWKSNEQNATREYDGVDYFDEVGSIPGVTLDKGSYHTLKGWSDVHISDYVRIDMLSTVGGFWSDMDILFVRPMNLLTANLHPETMGSTTTLVCVSIQKGFAGHSIGFMGSSGANSRFANLEKIARRKYDPKNYQSIGAHLMERHVNPTTEGVYNLSTDVVYRYNVTNIEETIHVESKEEWGRDVLRMPTIGVHWYGGLDSMSAYLNAITPQSYRGLPNIYGRILEGVFA